MAFDTECCAECHLFRLLKKALNGECHYAERHGTHKSVLNVAFNNFKTNFKMFYEIEHWVNLRKSF